MSLPICDRCNKSYETLEVEQLQLGPGPGVRGVTYTWTLCADCARGIIVDLTAYRTDGRFVISLSNPPKEIKS